MRIDLSQGAYRVLLRADKFPFTEGVSIAGILYALFEENECRACQWLNEFGFTLEKYRLQFGFYEGLSNSLLSPISAPPFPMGSYGVPVGYDNTVAVSDDLQPVSGGRLPRIDEDKDPTGNVWTGTAARPESKPPEEVPPQPPKLAPLAPPIPYTSHSRRKKEQSAILWFVNEEPVHFSNVLVEVDLAIFSVLNRIQKTPGDQETSYVPGPGGGVLKVKPNYELGFLEPTFELATEHLLFAVSLADDFLGVSSWVRELGLDPAAIYERIEKIHAVSRFENWEDKEQENKKIVLDMLAEKILNEKTNDTEENCTKTHSVIPVQTGTQTPAFAGVTKETALLRILDAAANRAQEAIRVIEDYVRFGLDDAQLTAQCKALRHGFAQNIAEIPRRDRLLSRDTPNDVGTDIQGENEYERNSIDDVLASNFSRLQESLRSLEEYGKILSASLGQGLEQLRYQAYSLQKSVFISGNTGDAIDAVDPDAELKLLEPQSTQHEPIVFEEACPFQEDEEPQEIQTETPEPQPEQISEQESASEPDVIPSIAVEPPKTLLQSSSLYVLLDCRDTLEDFTKLVQSLIAAKVDVVQLRDKNATDEVLLERGKSLRNLTAQTQTLFIMNDRPDLAQATEADGVHLGQEDLSEQLSIEDVRKIIGPEKLLGISTHTLEQVQKTLDDASGGAIDYIGVGPVFPSSTKEFDPDDIAGLVFAQNVAKLYEKLEQENKPTLPAFAIGGVTQENLDTVLQTGLRRVAVSAAVVNAPDPGEEAYQFKAKMRNEK